MMPSATAAKVDWVPAYLHWYYLLSSRCRFSVRSSLQKIILFSIVFKREVCELAMKKIEWKKSKNSKTSSRLPRVYFNPAASSVPVWIRSPSGPASPNRRYTAISIPRKRFSRRLWKQSGWRPAMIFWRHWTWKTQQQPCKPSQPDSSKNIYPGIIWPLSGCW